MSALTIISCHSEGTRFCEIQKIVVFLGAEQWEKGQQKRPSIKMEYSQPLLPYKAALSFTEIKAAV